MSSKCVKTSPDKAKVILEDELPVITGSLVDLCPDAVTVLTITEGVHNSSRVLYGNLFLHGRMNRVEELHIRVKSLFVHSSWVAFNQSDQKPSLRLLSISDCNLSLPVLGALSELRQLTIVSLRNCSLDELPFDLLANSPQLKVIDVSDNHFRFLPSFLYYQHTTAKPVINVTNNPIECSCLNSWIYSRGQFVGAPSCLSELKPCEPIFNVRLHSENAEARVVNKTIHTSVFTSRSFKLTCLLDSTVPGEVYWVTPIGVIPPPISTDNATYGLYSYFVQPILAPTVVRIFSNFSQSELHVDNVRGHLTGVWYCVGRSPLGISVSNSVQVDVVSSIYQAHVYVLSLCYGYGAMAVLLLVGILGGTIRYCSETRCLRRPQPPFAYGGKTFIGVIPVPEVDEDSCDDKRHDDQTYDINQGSMHYVSAGRICNICFRPPTYWFCDKCKAVHFVESVHELNAIDVLHAKLGSPEGDLLQEGEIQLVSLPQQLGPVTSGDTAKGTSETRRLLTIPECSGKQDKAPNTPSPATRVDVTRVTAAVPLLYVRSGNCVVRVRGERLGESPETCRPFQDLQSLKEAICFHSFHRPKSADVKLVVSNDKLAEEYREALADLARAVESPDPNHFREHLEEFRSRLRRDVGHGVKVLRGEFQGLRARSAKSVANLRTQSSVAAQKMRAGFSHGVEQVKGGMRSVAELCGASGSIGQTISVVSVYVDETDQVKKERFISDFVF
ncbi:Leucine rich repeat typical subtype [Fasciola hepatica]|uniref:Leucine rich repeat typical subtype n=1 Tax=Fasciola hepatica TaxID=6192 RepID=A0A4E0RHF2_FASHE|nr:Leucine rich repeat typical subtype [Fasciola hepatica]